MEKFTMTRISRASAPRATVAAFALLLLVMFGFSLTVGETSDAEAALAAERPAAEHVLAEGAVDTAEASAPDAVEAGGEQKVGHCTEGALPRRPSGRQAE